MFIASDKRKNNIAEYIIYMWHVEDMIRANGLDLERIERTVIDPMNLDEESRRRMVEWYESLIDMMRREDVVESGHLQINKNVMSQLVALHQSLLADPKNGLYTALFYRTLPYIVELRSRAGENRVGEIETCFTALYGMLMLRLQHKEVSEETMKALKQISDFVATLAAEFHKAEEAEAAAE